jgi:O-antigen/teichoic acid export membrane protein
MKRPNLARLEAWGERAPLAWVRILEPSLRSRLASGVIWSLVGAGFASGLQMASNVVCARVLGSTHFGELAIVLSTTNLFISLFTSGLSMTASKYVAELRNSDPRRAGAIMGLSWVTALVVGALCMLLLVPLAPWLSRDILGAPNLAQAVRLGGAVLFFGALNGCQIGALSGLEAFNVVAHGNLVRGLAIIVFVTVGAWFNGVNGAMWGNVAAGAITAVFYQLAVWRQCETHAIRISYRFGEADISILWRFTIPVLLTTLSFTPANWWSNVLLARTSGYAESGVFNAVFHWQMFILFFSNAVSRIGLPMLSNVRAENNGEKYGRFLGVNFVLTTLPALAIAVPVALAAPWILKLYGPAYAHGTTALVLISFASVLSAFNIPVGHAIWSLDANVPAVLLAVLNGVTLVLSAYALAGRGAAGLAGAYVIMGLVQTAVNIPFVFWLLRRRFAPAQPAAAELARV